MTMLTILYHSEYYNITRHMQIGGPMQTISNTDRAILRVGL